MNESMTKLLLMTFCFALLSNAPALAQQAKRRVAVMEFDFGAVQPWWGDLNWNVGLGISELMVDQLLKDGTFTLIERKRMSTVLAEQNISNSQRADPNSAAKIGKLAGADVIVVGVVSQFGTENKDMSISASVGRHIPWWWGKGGAGEVGKTKGKAKVAITTRMVDVNTGEILASVNGIGESQRSGLLLGGGGGGWYKGGSGGLSMTSGDFQQTILGEATLAAVKSAASQIVAEKHKVPVSKVELRGIIADVSSGSVIINIGQSHGVQVGAMLNVVRVTRTVNDPVTGKVLREAVDQVGQVQITETDDVSASGKIISGSGLRVGDIVRNQ